jgi:hypothetical protein
MILFLLVLGAISPSMAQQGQFHLASSPIIIEGATPGGVLATYSPIMAVYNIMIQLRGDDGQVYSFNLDAATVYCQGDKKVSDWTYLKKIGKKTTVTVLTNDDAKFKALVVWDQAPVMSDSSGSLIFTLPPMCK